MKLALALLASSSLFLNACGSVDTVDSADVPLKEGTGPVESPVGDQDEASKPKGEQAGGPGGANVEGGNTKATPVQDIHQRYSLTYSAKENRTHATAQFRVRTSLGDTIRFGRPSQVRFKGSAMRAIDGDDVNTAVTLLNHLTIIPLFSLFRTGTFYSDSHPAAADGTFEFEDDYGNKASTPASMPAVALGALVPEVDVKAPAAPLRVMLATPRAYEGASLECSLSSRHLDLEGRERSEYTSVTGTVEGTTGACSFPPERLRVHAAAAGELSLKVEYAVGSRSLDAAGRTKELRVSHVIEKALRPR